MTVTEHVESAETSTPASRPVDSIDALLIAGVIAAIVTSSIDLAVLDVDTLGPDDGSMKLIQRLVVYIPLVAALLKPVSILDAIARPALVLLVGFAGWTVLAAGFTDNPYVEVERAIWFLGFVLLACAVAARLGWGGLLAVVASAAAVLVVGGLIAHVGGWAAPDRTEFFDGGLFGYERVRGLQPTANGLGRAGAFLALIGVIGAVAPAPGRGSRSIVVLSVGAFVVGTAGAIASQSRFSILALAIATAIVIARRWRGLRHLAAIGVAGGTAVLLFVLLTGSLGPFSRSSDSSELETVLGRTQVWEESTRLATHEPVFGIGTEGMLDHFDRIESGGYAFWDPENGHNLLLHTAAAHGVFAAGLVAALLVFGMLRAWTVGRIGSASLITAFAVLGVVEALLIGSPTVPIAALIGGLYGADGFEPDRTAQT